MRVLELHFGVFELLPNIVLGKIKEGIHFDQELNAILGEHLIAHYGDNHHLGYVSVRENSYSVDPMVHLFNSRYDKLCCIGIVENQNSLLSSVALESKFFKKGKLKSFQDSNDALKWTNHQLESIINNTLTTSMN
ncbi:hypothetical protein LX97_02096 [Nonlabens dokdonensis]|jgi:hypothetical protein|uniref:GTP cyclohydrolase I n=2 Tax=Nonlabens dokdonensis TaxID=328515 RepID=L7WCA2_NONDD|nr:GTP cyclohydrolase I [Nonlabens dokdonensis]AGC77724.1 GTP cyclohydrolase I [Nonlabens dokdonensis DSW-6]PZX39739.1 hypothetical protein LX97_02096 [Nonlabens dokdonensis]